MQLTVRKLCALNMLPSTNHLVSNNTKAISGPFTSMRQHRPLHLRFRGSSCTRWPVYSAPLFLWLLLVMLPFPEWRTVPLVSAFLTSPNERRTEGKEEGTICCALLISSFVASSQGKFIDGEITPCGANPCVLVKGQNTSITLKFIASTFNLHV